MKMAENRLEVRRLDVGTEFFSGSESQSFSRGGYGLVPQPGGEPALIVVDVTYEFCGRGRPVPGGVDHGPRKSAGDAAWDAIDRLTKLIPAARRAGVPVIYSMNQERAHPVEIGGWAQKISGQADPEDLEIVAEIAPTESDLVVRKTKPSAFFGTPLVSWLVELGTDTAVIAGGTTSGCVRATVTDAFSNNLRTLVAVDAVFDRSRVSHEVNLFEMQQKYAGLVETEALMRWFGEG